MQRNYANKMIAASEVIQNLGTIVPILPTTESQVRPLTKLEPEEQTIVWQRATETAAHHPANWTQLSLGLNVPTWRVPIFMIKCKRVSW